jgi:hypothetical protein
VISVVLFAACETVSHENIDRWENTEKGAGKLRDALSGDHSPELRAHAAQVLIRTGELDFVTEILDSEGAPGRAQIMPPLVERLAREAALEDELSRPQPHHVAAKDALFELRDRAPNGLGASIDSTLIGWLTGGYYEGRSKSGRYSGRRIIRAIGTAAGPALVTAARRVLNRPPAADGKRDRLGDELLGSLALSASPGAVGLLLDLIEQPQPDATLAGRALDALERAFISPEGLEPVSGTALAPLAERLAGIVRNETLGARAADVAIALLASIGPECLEPLGGLLSFSHSNPGFRWAVAQNAVRCGQVAAIAPVAEGLPTTERYERAKLDRYLWREIVALPQKAEVAASARKLLESKSWVARVAGVELLGKLRVQKQTEGDAELVSRLASDSTRLRGWYPKTERKPDPTLGQVARQVAQGLRKVAQPTKSK